MNKKVYIVHKCSGEKFDSFPDYGKHDFENHYGYITVTHDLKVLFFYACDFERISYQDVTGFFDVFVE